MVVNQVFGQFSNWFQICNHLTSLTTKRFCHTKSLPCRVLTSYTMWIPENFLNRNLPRKKVQSVVECGGTIPQHHSTIVTGDDLPGCPVKIIPSIVWPLFVLKPESWLSIFGLVWMIKISYGLWKDKDYTAGCRDILKKYILYITIYLYCIICIHNSHIYIIHSPLHRDWILTVFILHLRSGLKNLLCLNVGLGL